MSSPDHSVSIHEAAHTLGHFLFGIPIVSVSIVPDGDSEGRCSTTEDANKRLCEICDGSYESEEERRVLDLVKSGQLEKAAEIAAAFDEGFDTDENSRIVDAHCIAMCAGPAATARYSGRPVSECLKGQQDLESLVECIDRWISDPDPEGFSRYLAEMLQRAQEIVDEPAHWYAIEELAKILDRDLEIDGITATSILAAALKEYRNHDLS